jgi:hypothetical protein
MSDFGDYLYEMDKTRTSDVEIEALLSGSPQLGDELQPLADLFSAIRADAGDDLTDGAVAGYVAAATAASAGAQPASPARNQPLRRPLLGTLRRRAATVTVAATVLLGGTSGLAMAADGAKPGDALYGIDRALEAVGIGAGAQQERLSEAEALIDNGELQQGLQHAAEALENDDSVGPAASQALMDAADRVRAAGADPSAVTREKVAGLLTYLAENAGGVDGRQVAELAVQIGRSNAPQSRGQADPQGPPADSPADPPGLTEREPGHPTGPPGQDKDKDKPGDPPGQDKDKNEPGPPDSLPNNQP